MCRGAAGGDDHRRTAPHAGDDGGGVGENYRPNDWHKIPPFPFSYSLARSAGTPTIGCRVWSESPA